MYQSKVVPIPKPPSSAMNIIVRNQARGNSPVNHPVKWKGFRRSSSPISASLSTIPAPHPASATPQTETITIPTNTTTPCWKSAITTPQ